VTNPATTNHHLLCPVEPTVTGEAATEEEEEEEEGEE
jgi:hypothetical protein